MLMNMNNGPLDHQSLTVDQQGTQVHVGNLGELLSLGTTTLQHYVQIPANGLTLWIPLVLDQELNRLGWHAS